MVGVDRNVRKGGGALLVGALVCFAGCYKGCDEFRFARSGQKAQGKVVEVSEWQQRGGNKLLVAFSYTDTAGKRRRGESLLPLDSQFEPGDDVDVVYIQGEKDSARLAAEGGVMGVLLFTLAGVGLAIHGAIRLSRYQPA